MAALNVALLHWNQSERSHVLYQISTFFHGLATDECAEERPEAPLRGAEGTADPVSVRRINATISPDERVPLTFGEAWAAMYICIHALTSK
eukprot:4185179-Alexandrium_andersonii.AAC.1